MLHMFWTLCNLYVKIAKVGTQILFLFKSQIYKFLGSFCYRKSKNFLGVPVCKSQNRRFLRCDSPLIANPQIFFPYDMAL